MQNFYDKIDEIILKDNRYKTDAYEFVMRALWFTQAKLKKQGHISGRELAHGIKDFILEQYGPMAKAVLGHWGIKGTEDFGEIVFNMVEKGLLNKTEEDKKSDFKGIYDFDEAFDIFKNNSFEKLGAGQKRQAWNQKPKFSAPKLTKAFPKNPGNKNLN